MVVKFGANKRQDAEPSQQLTKITRERASWMCRWPRTCQVLREQRSAYLQLTPKIATGMFITSPEVTNTGPGF